MNEFDNHKIYQPFQVVAALYNMGDVVNKAAHENLRLLTQWISFLSDLQAY